ncbi:tRNA pseudouridine(55) synthase TruB [Lentisphaera marina]|uniref:tRNA pseudouridine(55) synthase TruB n=1 Tax=Lentisphaera marina TaxID=1111041 RepID=UPI0023651837|nr:tRNA pseudouridine(55) synthase TruB [Lentisphaera marina]MDD7983364.1 tRNA pseudouridine(55) synthase TruB [Lentisphaera marina]
MGRRRRKNPTPDFDGILLVDKPKEWTSHDVVNLVRNRYRFNKVGHCGTLDPLATGLIVVVIGKATKLASKLTADDKVYITEMTLGRETDSHDEEGETTREASFEHVTEEQIQQCAKDFTGDQMQVPPMVSALKKDGKKLYELARQGIEVEREARPVTFHSLDIDKIELPKVHFTLHCSKGSYVRVLCHDMGRKMESAAYMSNLRRTKSGQFSLDNAVEVTHLKTIEREEVEKLIIPIDQVEIAED